MGNLATIIVNAIMEEAAKKLQSLGYNSYSFDYEQTFTIDGIRNNPRCKIFARKSSISAKQLFLLNGVSTEENGRLRVDLTIPGILLKFEKAGFVCNDPKFSCGVMGWLQLTDIRVTGAISMDMRNSFKFDHISIKPNISTINMCSHEKVSTLIKTDIKLTVNKKDYSELATSVLRTQVPAVLNFILELILKNYEESILQFLNTHVPEMQAPCAFD